MKRIRTFDILAVLAMPVLTLAALIGLAVGIALKTDVATALIAICLILLADITLDDLLKKRGKP